MLVTSIQVIPTLDHAHEHASLIFDSEKRKIAIAGDVFWWTNEKSQKTNNVDDLLTKKIFLLIKFRN